MAKHLIAPHLRLSLLPQIHEDMESVFEKHKEEYNIGSITCCGHSLGGALATLAAYDLAQEAYVPDGVRVRVYSFEAPKVGEGLPPLKASYVIVRSLSRGSHLG